MGSAGANLRVDSVQLQYILSAIRDITLLFPFRLPATQFQVISSIQAFERKKLSLVTMMSKTHREISITATRQGPQHPFAVKKPRLTLVLAAQRHSMISSQSHSTKCAWSSPRIHQDLTEIPAFLIAAVQVIITPADVSV